MLVKPNRLLILLGYVGVMISIIMLMSPREISLTKDLSFKVFSIDDLLPTPKEPKVDLSAIKALESKIDRLEKNTEGNLEDTLRTAQETKDTLQLVPEKLNKEIQLPSEHPYALANIFKALQGLSTQAELIRVVHYGDSQIEGDRISEYLRNRFQSRFRWLWGRYGTRNRN
ncbi:MAG: hypothetical protein ACPGJS_04470 [Flammeovirgaceae bacterium]